MRTPASVLLLPVLVLALEGCGGSPDRDNAGRSLTVPRYGQFPAQTVEVTHGTLSECRAEADAFSRAAESFLLPFPSDADNYRVLAQVQFTAFMAHRCDPAILREAVSRRLTPGQLREVLAFFGFMGEVGRGLRVASGDEAPSPHRNHDARPFHGSDGIDGH